MRGSEWRAGEKIFSHYTFAHSLGSFRRYLLEVKIDGPNVSVKVHYGSSKEFLTRNWDLP